MGLDVDPGRKRRILRLDRQLRRAALAHMGELSVDARRIDDGKPGDEGDERETQRSRRHAPSTGEPSGGRQLGRFSSGLL